MKKKKTFEEQIKQSLRDLGEEPPKQIWEQLEQGIPEIYHSPKINKMKQLVLMLAALVVGAGGMYVFQNQSVEAPSEKQQEEAVHQPMVVEGERDDVAEIIHPLLMRANKAEKVLAVYVYMDDCIFCARLEDEVLAKKEVKELMAATAYQAELHLLDKKVKPFVQQLGIKAAPAFLFFNKNGEMVHKILGFREKATFLELWEEGIEIANSEQSIKEDNLSVIAENKLQLYPNPTEGAFTLSTLATEEKAVIQILNIEGKILLEQKLEPFSGELQVELDISDYPSGNYMVHFMQGKRRLTKQVLRK